MMRQRPHRVRTVYQSAGGWGDLWALRFGKYAKLAEAVLSDQFLQHEQD